MATYYSQNSGNWSTLTNWNSARNGSGGSPASIAAMDDQTFVIQPGHTVIFDVEDALECDGSISGWTTGISGITIEGVSSGTPGELTLSSTANSTNRIYGLRLKNGMYIQGTNMTIKGKLTAGSQETPIPSNSKTIIEMQDPGVTSPYTIIGGTYLVIALYGTGPIEPVYELTSAAASSDTQLQVRGLRDYTNPNVETEWGAECDIAICNLGSTYNIVRKKLSATNPVGDGVLNLSSAIGSSRVQGALVCLINRNITIRMGNAPTAESYCFRDMSDAIFDSVLIYSMTNTAENGTGIYYSYRTIVQGTSIIYSSSRCFMYGDYNVISGRSVLMGSSSYGLMTGYTAFWKIIDETVCCGAARVLGARSTSTSGYAFEISGNVIIAGITYGVGDAYGGPCVIKDNVKIYGCGRGISGVGGGEFYNVKIYNCSYGLYDLQKCKLYSCEIGIDSTNTIDIYSSGCESWNTKFGSSTQVSNYQSKYSENTLYYSVISWNHNNIESKYPTSWMPGGTVIPNSSYSPMPDGHIEICQMNFSQPSGMAAGTYNRNWVDIPILIRAGDINNINLWMVKNINNMGIIPRAAIFTYDGDPWLITPIDLYIMTDNTNEQTDILVYDASLETVDIQVFLRVWGGHTSGTLYWAYTIDRWGAKDTQGFVTG